MKKVNTPIDIASTTYKLFFMTVKKLRQILSGYDDSLHVLLRGYEGGIKEISKHSMIRIKKNVNKECYLGPHEQNNEDYDAEGVILE